MSANDLRASLTDCSRDSVARNAPSGDVESRADHDPASGRFTRGNRAALVTGARSAALWTAIDATLQARQAALIADQGFTLETAPRALLTVTRRLVEAEAIAESGFARIGEAGGPMTDSDRVRRCVAVWQAGCDRVERLTRLLPAGLGRVPRDTHDDIAAFLTTQSETGAQP
jgi:hypothetical protein